MALAKKCDLCGSLYENYKTNTKYGLVTNGLKLGYFDGAGLYISGKSFELCPACIPSILDHMSSLERTVLEEGDKS